MVELFMHASALIKFVLLVLVALSVMSWGITLYKYLQLQMVTRESAQVLAALEASRPGGDLSVLYTAAGSLRVSPLARIVSSVAPGTARRSPAQITRAIESCRAQETERLESYLIFLATTGSTAPFIGLLGTVWGIMDAFKGIGAAGSASLAVVAPAIAEALVTTAAGLAAAIPAVMAYNVYVNWVRKLSVTIDDFSETLQGLLGAKGA